MRPLLSLKSLIRTPVRTLLTFLLLAAASFALFSRASEYAIVSKEIDRAAGFYRGICSLDNGLPRTDALDSLGYNMPVVAFNMLTSEFGYEPPQPLTQEQIDAFMSLPQVSGIDKRYMTAGISMDGFIRADFRDEPIYGYTNRFIVEGNFFERLRTPDISEWENWITLRNAKLLAGDPWLLSVGPTISMLTIAWEPENDEQRNEIWASVTSGSGTADRTYSYLIGNPFHQRWFNSLTEGYRYIAIGRWEPRRQSFRTFQLGNQDSMDFWPSFVSIEGQPGNYLEKEEFAPLRTLIEITDNDRHTFDMIYTSDMMSILRFADDNMVIINGRALTVEDEGTANCVVSREFLGRNYLNLGDTITMSLGGKLLYQNAAIGAVSVTPERYVPPVETVELTIVGVWADTDSIADRMKFVNWGYSRHAIFVPSTLLPVEIPQDHEYYPGEISLIIDNASESATFLKSAEALADEMGLRLFFNDGGWMRIEESLNIAVQMSYITMGLFLLASAAAMVLAVWVYIWHSRRVFAIMRATGTQQSKAYRTLLIPFVVIVILAIPFGAAAGLYFTEESVVPILESIAESVPDYDPDAAFPTGVISLTALCGFLFLSITVILFLHSLGRASPLALLQGDIGKRKKHKERIEVSVRTSSDITPFIDLEQPLLITAPENKGYPAFFHIIRNIARHLRRTAFKAVLSLILTILFCGAVGALIFTRYIYEDLFNKAEIRGSFTYAASDVVEDIVKSEFFKDVFYRDASYLHMTLGLNMLLNFEMDTTIIVTNNVERYISDSGVSDFNITYADDFDGYMMEYQIGRKPIVVGANLMRALELSFGDNVRVSDAGVSEVVLSFIEERHTPDPEDDERTARSKRDMRNHFINYISNTFTVVGMVDCDDFGTSVFIPVGPTAVKTFDNGDYSFASSSPQIMSFFTVDYVDFVIADRERFAETIEYMERLWARSLRLLAEAQYHIDTTEVENMAGIIELVDLLFPFAVAVAVFIGILVPTLMILQTRKEAAVMRVQGTTRLRTGSILALEQIFICIIGMALTAGALAIYDIDLLKRSAQTLILCGGLYISGYVLASIITTIIITRSKVLQLLQVKE